MGMFNGFAKFWRSLGARRGTKTKLGNNYTHYYGLDRAPYLNDIAEHRSHRRANRYRNSNGYDERAFKAAPAHIQDKIRFAAKVGALV